MVLRCKPEVQYNERFLEFSGHYGVEIRLCTPGAGYEKIRSMRLSVFWTYLLIKLLQHLAKEDGLQMSVTSLIKALEGIREVLLAYSDNTAVKKLEDQSPLQRQLLTAFGLSDST